MQGFAIRVRAPGVNVTKKLDRHGFAEVTFSGQYPIGKVEYRDPALPVAVTLSRFPPSFRWMPTNSSLPATVMQFTVKNLGAEPVDVDLGGYLENAVCMNVGHGVAGVHRRPRHVRARG